MLEARLAEADNSLGGLTKQERKQVGDLLRNVLLKMDSTDSKKKMKPVKKCFGELVIRSANTRVLVEFYRDIIGLELYATIGSATFLKIAEASEGHPQLLALFDKLHSYSGPKDMQPDNADARVGPLHHFVFVLDKRDFNSERDRLKSANVEIQLDEHIQFGRRSIYMYDPDGNSVELVRYDETILDKAANQRARIFGDKDND